MYNKIPTNEYVIVATWNCKVFLGLLDVNLNDYVVLKDGVEVYELGNVTTTYMIPEITVDKADIEIMAPIQYMTVEERLY